MAEAAEKTPVKSEEKAIEREPPSSGRRSEICAANSIGCSRTFPGARVALDSPAARPATMSRRQGRRG